MPDATNPSSPHRICLACHLGHTHHQSIAHVEWLDEQLVVVPDVGAEVCDFCGAVSLADDRLWRLNQLLRRGDNLQPTSGRGPHRSTIM